MKVTIIYDNTAFREDLQADWGFSALVETKGRKTLFDTGGNSEILLSNMEKLGINLNSQIRGEPIFTGVIVPVSFDFLGISPRVPLRCKW